MSETYNGWANRETWSVNLWLTNDEGAYAYLRDATRRALDSLPDHTAARTVLADLLRDEVPTSGIVRDEMSWHRVDWHEIADAALEES